MTGRDVDRRTRAGAIVGLGALLMLVVVLRVGVSEEVGDRIVLPIFLALLALAVGLSRRRLRLLATAAGAGIPAGLALGAALRLAMLIAALMGGQVNRTVGGTVGLVVFAAVPATAISGLLVLARKLARVRPPVMAAVMLLVGGAVLLLPGDTRAELAREGALWVNLVTFLAPFALFGWLVVTLQERIEAWWDRRTARPDVPAAGVEVAPA